MQVGCLAPYFTLRAHLPSLRPYHPECTQSRLISEAKQSWAWLVLGWDSPSPSLEHSTPASRAISLHNFKLSFIAQQWLLNLSISERFQLFLPLKKEKIKSPLAYSHTETLWDEKR